MLQMGAAAQVGFLGGAKHLLEMAVLAMVHGSRALELQDFAAAKAAYGRQAELYRREGADFGEYMALTNLSMVLLDTGEVDAAIDALQRVLDGSRGDLQRLQQRLQSLLTAWEGDRAEEPMAATRERPVRVRS